jgi:glycosyltransferase domain-containing protein
MNRLTILVPIKDNPQKTSHFLKHNIFPEFDYLFADGSLSAENKIIFNKKMPNNVRYEAFDYDRDIPTYLTKIMECTKKINTEYIMLVDAGDYLFPLQLQNHITFLESHKEYSLAGSDVLMSRVVGSKITKPFKVIDLKKVDELKAKECLEQIRDSYTYFWYCIFRKPLFVKIWHFLSEETPLHPFMEYTPTLISLQESVVKNLGQTYLLRIQDSPKNQTVYSNDFHYNTNISYSKEFVNFANKIEAKFGLNSKLILESHQKNTAKIVNQLRINLLINRFTRIVFTLLRIRRNTSMNAFDRNFRMFLYYLTWLKPIKGTIIPRIFQLQNFDKVYGELCNNVRVQDKG